MVIITLSTSVRYSPTRKPSTRSPSTKHYTDLSYLGFALRKDSVTLTISIMPSLHTITAMVIYGKVDRENKLAFVLLEGRRWSAWLIWWAASCRGGGRALKSQSVESLLEWGTNPSTSPYYSSTLETRLIYAPEYHRYLFYDYPHSSPQFWINSNSICSYFASLKIRYLSECR
jgi:hypothetical protein